MANKRGKAKPEIQGRRSAKPSRTSEALRQSVFDLTSEMEEPLRYAQQMIHVIGLVDVREDEDKEAIGLVAQEASVKLQAVSARLRRLFATCRAP